MAGLAQPKTGGRTRGTPNKVTAKLKEAILAAFDEVGGKDYLVQVARDEPRVFCALLARLIPAELNASLQHDGAPNVTFRNFAGSASRWAPQEPLEPDEVDLSVGDSAGSSIGTAGFTPSVP